MTRLIKEAPDPGEAGRRAAAGLLSLREAVRSLAGAVRALRLVLRPVIWTQQYPVYTCPYVDYVWSDEPEMSVPVHCPRSWYRRGLDTAELRMQFYDHWMADHSCGDTETDLRRAGHFASKILEGP